MLICYSRLSKDITDYGRVRTTGAFNLLVNSSKEFQSHARAAAHSQEKIFVRRYGGLGLKVDCVMQNCYVLMFGFAKSKIGRCQILQKKREREFFGFTSDVPRKIGYFYAR